MLAAALEIIDRDGGADALSMRRSWLRALDRDPMILYRHRAGQGPPCWPASPRPSWPELYVDIRRPDDW